MKQRLSAEFEILEIHPREPHNFGNQVVKLLQKGKRKGELLRETFYYGFFSRRFYFQMLSFSMLEICSRQIGYLRVLLDMRLLTWPDTVFECTHRLLNS